MFNAPVESILHMLVWISNNVLSTLPMFESIAEVEGKLRYVLEDDRERPDRERRLQFAVGIFRRGIVRFPKQYFREQAGAAAIPPYSCSELEANRHATKFLDVFSIGEKQRGQIDLMMLQPVPIMYDSPTGRTYWDFMHLDDFFRWLLVSAREWYSSQHGDRFTLALKNHLELETNAEVIAWKKNYRASDQASVAAESEVDLPIRNANRVYVVECKAYSKSRLFWLGEPDAVSDRSAKIGEAVNQAKKAQAVVESLRIAGEAELASNRPIDWVVCMPSQEFLKPFDRYGLLSTTIPKICTPEELSRYFNDERNRSLAASRL